MRSESTVAVMKRLRFAMAELEVVSKIANSEHQPVLLARINVLKKGVRDCIDALRAESQASPAAQK